MFNVLWNIPPSCMHTLSCVPLVSAVLLRGCHSELWNSMISPYTVGSCTSSIHCSLCYCRSPNCSTFIRYVPCHPCLSRSLLIKESHHFQSCRPIFIQCSLKPTNQWRPRRRNHFSIFISISELVQLVKLLFVLTSKVYFTVITCSQFAENTHSFFLSCKLVTAFSFPSTQLASTHFLNIGQFKGRGAWRPLKCWKSWVYYRTAPHLNVASKFL